MEAEKGINMLNKLINAVKQSFKQPEPVNPASFDDPVALETTWTPAKRGGANFCTHKLRRINPSRCEFKITAGAMLFSVLFLAVGIGVLIAALVMLGGQGLSGQVLPLLMMTVLGLVFSAVGAGLLARQSIPTVLDTKLGLCWKGRKDPRMVAARDKMKLCLSLDEVHAIQLISEHCRSSGENSRSYYSYELNLVRHDGSRVNLVDHGNAKRIRQDADLLSNCLGVPVWDAARHR